MAEIQKIYRGMQNGAEIIDDNFKIIDEKVKSLEPIGDTGKFIPLTMASGFTANQAEYYIKGGWIFITVQGARPNETITGESYYTFLTLPAAITAHLTHTEAFMWSNFQGGGTAYSGGILNNGQVQLYLSPKTNSISNVNRFSFNMVIPMRPGK